MVGINSSAKTLLSSPVTYKIGNYPYKNKTSPKKKHRPKHTKMFFINIQFQKRYDNENEKKLWRCLWNFIPAIRPNWKM